MSRVELLEKVKKQIEEKGTIRYKYNDGSCMCAVGYVLAECGIDMTPFVENKMINSDPISLIANTEDDILNSIVANGLIVDNLIKLQNVNDSYSDNDIRNDEVIAVIDELIADFRKADKEGK